MAFFATVRRQSVSLPHAVPALRAGQFALYTPSQPLERFIRARPALQSKNDAAAAPPTLFGLMTGTLTDLDYYARDEGAGWLADMARGICCPRAAGGVLLAHDPASDSWRTVGDTEPLVAASYLFQPPPNAAVGLQTMYQRTVTASSIRHGGAAGLRRCLEGRDEVCWINHTGIPLDVARILPKNMPDADKQRVLEEFALPGDPATAPLASGRDIRLFLFLNTGVEYFFERFWFGLRCIGTNIYVCHSFIDGAEGVLNTFGITNGPMMYSWPRVHGWLVRPPKPLAEDLPPAALFRWHYLQGVLKKFRHDDYLSVPNIRVRHAKDWFDYRDNGREREKDFDWSTHLRRRLARKGQTS